MAFDHQDGGRGSPHGLKVLNFPHLVIVILLNFCGNLFKRDLNRNLNKKSSRWDNDCFFAVSKPYLFFFPFVGECHGLCARLQLEPLQNIVEV